jgi:hypothetical protein
VAKKIFENKPEGRRKVRRPRMRWLEDAEKRMPKTNTREEWVSVSKEVKAFRGL